MADNPFLENTSTFMLAGTCPVTFQPLALAACMLFKNNSGASVLSVIFIKSTCNFCRESRALFISISLPISKSPGHIDLMPSNLGPEVNMVGPINWLF